MIQFHELPACRQYYRQPALENAVGFIPEFLDLRDPRSAREQIAETYVGGWSSFSGFKRDIRADAPDSEVYNLFGLKYPGDPVLPPLAYAMLRDEMIVVYPSAWVAIVQPDGTFDVSRLD